jgi:protein-tyrosine kinase
MKVDVFGQVNRLTQAVRSLPGVRSSAPSLVVQPSGVPMEAFRLLAMNVQVLLPREGKRGVAIMSAGRGEGRTFVAGNLALALAEETPTILVEELGDQMPLQERLSGYKNGRSDIVPDELQEHLLKTDFANIFLHTPDRGTVVNRLSLTTETASDAGFITIVDTPPASTSSNAFLLAKEVGHVIYIVKQEPQNMDLHRQIREQLERLDVKIIGLVLSEA